MKIMKIVNLTPHTINIFDEDGKEVKVIPPSGELARISTSKEKIGTVLGIPLFETVPGELTGLPAPSNGVIYVVSGIVRSHVPDREDVFQPGELLRNDAGQPIGCIGLSR